jgi:hypothetical protein
MEYRVIGQNGRLITELVQISDPDCFALSKFGFEAKNKNVMV